MTRHSNEKHENKVFVTNRDIIKKLKVLAPVS